MINIKIKIIVNKAKLFRLVSLFQLFVVIHFVIRPRDFALYLHFRGAIILPPSVTTVRGTTTLTHTHTHTHTHTFHSPVTLFLLSLFPLPLPLPFPFLSLISTCNQTALHQNNNFHPSTSRLHPLFTIQESKALPLPDYLLLNPSIDLYIA